ncbi:MULTISPECIES: single-stranded-DNA-specific exonuclease RecJ [Rhodomicrobium]|uniref:single-stranded-DNA-specific exonuclease RecJ n=1 Tax=Rhodomicrobium TaxID=1068 RepID=UPI000B4B1216|nr:MULTISPECIES: single-stranded-DNA-specific exonuclease RecJ [Rhodomicrobium]
MLAGTALKQTAANEPGVFLGVMRSVKGQVWRERLSAEQARLAAAICQHHDLPELLGRILAARGGTLENIPDMMAPTLKALLPDPSSLQDMDLGAARFADAIQKGESIAIFGDYDVDGASSAALVRRFLRAHGRDAVIYIPDRIFEGYGPNVAAIEGLVERGAQLIVTVDCGSTSHEPLAAARRLGADVVVIDHHQMGEELPAAVAVINPNRQDDLSAQGHLCAAGVTFLFLIAVTRHLRRAGWYANGKAAEPDLLALLDIVALATVCDVVPLTGINRAFVAQGLKVMHRRQNVGLRALADAAGLNSAPTPYHLGYILGPRINAGGRIGDAALGARLLSSDDEGEAARIAATLTQLNRERQEMEQRCCLEAIAMAEARLEATPDLPLILVGSEAWHKGLVGLVASRLMDRFRRPALVMAWDGEAGDGTGSARSIAGADIGHAVRAALAKGLAKKGGGHAMAAGVTIERGRLEELEAFLIAELASSVTTARDISALSVDGALTPEGATSEFVDLLEKAGPYGAGHAAPRFVFPAHRIGFAKLMGEAHVRCTLKSGGGASIGAIAFRAVGTPIGEALLSGDGRPFHIAGRLQRDTWGGREKIEVLIEDLADPMQQKL